jgi:hypothetical protein
VTIRGLEIDFQGRERGLKADQMIYTATIYSNSPSSSIFDYIDYVKTWLIQRYGNYAGFSLASVDGKKMAGITKFRDRTHAGRSLAKKLSKYANHKEVLILALPRGGVAVGV